MNAAELKKKTHEILGLGEIYEMALIRKADIDQEGRSVGHPVDLILSVTDTGVGTRENGWVTFEEIVANGNTIEFFDNHDEDVTVLV